MVSFPLIALIVLPLLVSSAEWQPPSKTDRRGPCPALNTLANHAIIVRNGTDVPINDLFALSETYFGVSGSELHRLLLLPVIQYNLTKVRDDGVITVTLDALFKHNRPFEHDSSHVRHDEAFGRKKSHTVDCGLVESLFSINKTSDIVTANDIAKHRRARIFDSRCYNPQFSNFTLPSRQRQLFSVAVEDTFMLAFGVDADLGFVTKKNLYEFLVLERFPTDYKPRQTLGYPLLTPAGATDKVMSFSFAITSALDADIDCDEISPTAICKTNKKGKQKCKRVKKGKMRTDGKKGFCKIPKFV